jgi:hypothetical protein
LLVYPQVVRKVPDVVSLYLDALKAAPVLCGDEETPTHAELSTSPREMFSMSASTHSSFVRCGHTP